MSTRSRPVTSVTATGSQPPLEGRRLAPPWERSSRAARSALQRVARWLLHLWRSSLQLRVIVSTMLLGLIVVLMLGTYLYQRIADGLVNDRILTARAEATSQTRAAQIKFDSAGRMDASSLSQLAFDVVGQLSSPGADQSREVILTHATNNTGPASVPTVLSSEVGLASVPARLRTAIAADPSHQQVQIISIRSTDGTLVPAAIVGSRVTLPAAGQYELYFVFPLEREQQTLRVVGRTFSLGGFVLVLLLGGVAYVVTRIVVDPVRRAALVAERLSSGRLHERMRAHGEDDIARLGKAFNAMADSLQKQIRQLEDLSRVQQRFVSDVSHELRTPLTTIRMAGDLIHEPVTTSIRRLPALLSCCTTRSIVLSPCWRTCWRSAVSTRGRRRSTWRQRICATRSGAPSRRRPGWPRAVAVAWRSSRARVPVLPRSTRAGSSGSCGTWWPTPSSTARGAR